MRDDRTESAILRDRLLGAGGHADAQTTRSARRSGDVGGHDVRGVAIEGDPSAVVAHGRARVGVTCRLLDVAKWHAGIERGGDERVAEGVRTDCFADPRSPSDPPDDPARSMAIEAATVATEEDRPARSLANREIDGPGSARRHRDRHGLSSLSQDGERPVPTLKSERLDVCADRFGDPQAIQREQRDERVLSRRSKSCGDKERADLIAVEADCVRLVVKARPPDVDCW